MIDDEALLSIVDMDDFMSFDRLQRDLRTNSSVVYTKADFLFRAGTWRQQDVSSGVSKLRRGGHRVVVYGHSDLCLSRLQVARLRLLGVRAIWGVNVTFRSSLLRPYPLGLCDPNSDGPDHVVLGDTSAFATVIKRTHRSENFSGRLYANFTLRNHPERRKVLQIVTTLPSAVASDTHITKDGRESYLRSLRSSDLVVCPRGNGWDTHRVWETLYLGGTPVVLDSVASRLLLEDLPVVRLRKWEDLTNLDLLEGKWHACQEHRHDPQSLKRSHYVRRIVDSAAH